MGFFNFFEKYRLVKTLDTDCRFDGKKYSVFVNLYETKSGKRKYDVSSLVPYPHMNKWITGTEIFNLKVRRWLDGRYDPEIPRYSELQEEDTANALKGKI